MENMQQAWNGGHRYMRTLMEGDRRVHTEFLFANPPNINEW